MKKEEQKLINTNAITKHNAIAIPCDYQSWKFSFNLIQKCLQLSLKSRCRINLKSNWKNLRIELPKRKFNLTLELYSVEWV